MENLIANDKFNGFLSKMLKASRHRLPARMLDADMGKRQDAKRGQTY